MENGGRRGLFGFVDGGEDLCVGFEGVVDHGPGGFGAPAAAAVEKARVPVEKKALGEGAVDLGGLDFAEVGLEHMDVDDALDGEDADVGKHVDVTGPDEEGPDRRPVPARTARRATVEGLMPAAA